MLARSDDGSDVKVQSRQVCLSAQWTGERSAKWALKTAECPAAAVGAPWSKARPMEGPDESVRHEGFPDLGSYGCCCYLRFG